MEFIQKGVGCLGDARENYLRQLARDRVKRIVFLASQIQDQTKCTWGSALRAAEEIVRREAN